MHIMKNQKDIVNISIIFSENIMVVLVLNHLNENFSNKKLEFFRKNTIKITKSPIYLHKPNY